MYESHITVADVTDEKFKTVCKEYGLKPVIIEKDTGSELRQVMTAKFHRTKVLEQALNEMNEIATKFDNIIRKKLEFIVGKNSTLPAYKYLEFHSKYKVPQEMESIFTKTVLDNGGHVAKNVARPGNFMFATSRDKAVHTAIQKNLAEFELINTISECVVYDDNESIDSKWYSCFECPIKRSLL